MNKAGIELSINFLVTFILAIVVFSLGIFLIQTITDKGIEASGITQDYLESRIDKLTCSAREKVCVSNNHQIVKRGEPAVFGIYIFNYLDDEENFVVTVGDSEAYDEQTQELTTIRTSVLGTDHAREIPPRVQQKIPIAILVPKDTMKGQYTYDITIDSDATELSGEDPYPLVRDTLTFTVK